MTLFFLLFPNLQAVINCCNILKERMAPIAKEMPKAKWEEIIAKCYTVGVDLSAKYRYLLSLLLAFNIDSNKEFRYQFPQFRSLIKGVSQ
jgi:hypothetical protein